MGLCFEIAPGEHERQGVYIHLARIHLQIDQVAEARLALDEVNLAVYRTLKDRVGKNLENRTAELVPSAEVR